MALRSRFSLLPLFLLVLPSLCLALDISGVVVDQQDRPPAGVSVAGGEAGDRFDEAKLAQAITDSEGKFTLTGVAEPKEFDFVPVEASLTITIGAILTLAVLMQVTAE